MDYKQLTEKEEELIQAIRNYKKSYPRSTELEWHATQLFEEMMDSKE